MKAAIIAILIASSILPVNLVWAQYTQPSTTLSVQVLTPYSYKAEDGSTVVIGEVQNKNNFPVTGVKIGVSFYDASGKILEYTVGTTLLKVVPAGGKAPFSISSVKKDPAITDISVNLTGFNSSPARQPVLHIVPGVMEISDQLTLSGTITNGGTIATTGTKIYLLSYDAFERVVGITIAVPESGNLAAGQLVNFDLTFTPDSKTKSYKLVAESDHFQSPLIAITNVKGTLSAPTKLVTISDIKVTDPAGNKYATISLGDNVNIQSEIWIKYSADQSAEQPYAYYVQIKRVGNEDVPSIVEFIGKTEGAFHGTEKQDVSVTWVPENKGAFFIEVYIWDLNAVALASPSSIINVVLVQ